MKKDLQQRPLKMNEVGRAEVFVNRHILIGLEKGAGQIILLLVDSWNRSYRAFQMHPYH